MPESVEQYVAIVAGVMALLSVCNCVFSVVVASHVLRTLRREAQEREDARGRVRGAKGRFVSKA